MKKILITTNKLNETRLAVLDNDILYNLEIENKKIYSKKGNIYKGVVTKVEFSLDAVFINYGAVRDGFLPFKEITKEYADKILYPDKNNFIKNMEIIVQIEKEERKNKSAALTTYITLAGFYLVLMPNSYNLEGISRHIDGEKRLNLKEKLNNITIPNNMGLIIRTAGIGKSLEELQWELNILVFQYNMIKDLYKVSKAPSLIHEESSLIVRSIRDYLRNDIKEIIVDNMSTFNSLYKYLKCISSEYANKIKFYFDKVPIFSKFNIEKQIELSFKREIFLPSGGSIIIDSTEALISIDVNSAKSNKCYDIKETALQTNLEAIEEIARQMRLRDLGGLIVVDFIDMPESFNQKIIEKKLKEAVSFDKAKIKIGKISKFGLLELSRQRIRISNTDLNKNICDKCNGIGRIETSDYLIKKIISLLEEEAKDSKILNLELSNKLSNYFFNLKKRELNKIEKSYNVDINLIENNNISFNDYKIYKIIKISKNIIKNDLKYVNTTHISHIFKSLFKVNYNRK